MPLQQLARLRIDLNPVRVLNPRLSTQGSEAEIFGENELSATHVRALVPVSELPELLADLIRTVHAQLQPIAVKRRYRQVRIPRERRKPGQLADLLEVGALAARVITKNYKN